MKVVNKERENKQIPQFSLGAYMGAICGIKVEIHRCVLKCIAQLLFFAGTEIDALHLFSV